ncbi:PREDICTED: uncharacterized protein LOC104798755 [Tarenaya hassleriana]|uniref:uncharacterized protein LOC104798755 n=1 Tax=Tarenaya hassleriana TaxID=28532 RepID=UPI00053C1510|nr:PREDICTED: uncharacterized protein LOC104798755 [Tarenaya hassleriana]
MDHLKKSSSSSSSSYSDQDLVEQVQIINGLLEECWFFDNLLNRRSSVLRYSRSDPSPSLSSSSTEKPANSAPEKILEDSKGRCLIRAPSLPPCVERSEGRGEAAAKKINRQLSEKRVRVQESRPGSTYLRKKEPVVQDKVREGSRRDVESVSVRSSSTCQSLQRTKTFPSYVTRDEALDEFQDQESEERLGFLIREAVASSSELKPRRQNVSKVSRIPRHRPPRNSRSEGEIVGETNPSRRKLRIRPNKPEPDSNLMMMTTMGSRREMKDQIRFWARAVASDAKQEC